MTETVYDLPVGDVRFVKELYPRLREDDAAIERYRAAIDLLPPIVVARDGILVDGFHRWQAHRRDGLDAIRVINLGDTSDSEIIRESYRRNASHGQQLSTSDKRAAANKLYLMLDGSQDERQREIAGLLSITLGTAKTYTSEARRYEKEQQQAKAWDLWLDCYNYAEIESQISVTDQTIINWISKIRMDSTFRDPPDSRQHFDVWSFGTDGGESSYFGRMPPQVVENLLWFYTEPGQIVVDPFAGGGTTIDVAKSMGRRVWASDRKPSTPTLPIYQHDITTGWPDAAPRRADLILLDPPYWKQAAGRYSDDPQDLANMTLDDFLNSWRLVIKTCAEHISDGGRLAYIVSPAEDGDRVVDLALAMHDALIDDEFIVERRIIVPYSTQQATGQQVTWARDNKRMLKLYRDLVIMRRSR